MKKYFSIFLTLMCLFTFTTLTVYASDSQQQRPSLNERINNILLTPDGATNFYRFAFYLDAEGYVNVDKTVLDEIVSQYDEVLQIHGFYVYESENLASFDIIVDFDADREKVKEEIYTKIKEKYPEFEFIIIDDYDISD